MSNDGILFILQVAVASKLVNRHRLTEESIVILSFYQEQSSLISKKLQQKGHKNITVLSVDCCQGTSKVVYMYCLGVNLFLREKSNHSINKILSITYLFLAL